LIGVIPVITTAANALYVQRLLSVSDGLSAHQKYQSVSDVQTKSGSKLLSNDVAIPFTSENMNKPSLSKMAAEYFPAIQYDAQLSCFDKEQIKKIGVVVFKAFLDPTEGNKVNFSAVESFVGELDRNSRNPATGSSNFIDNIVNSNSEYIYLFSNIQLSTLSGIDIFIAPNQTMADLGLNSNDTAKTISLSTMNSGIEKCFNKVASIEEKDIDIVCDAGLANIAQFIKTCRNESGTYDVCGSSNNLDKAWSCTSKDDVLQWRSILGKYDNFCKYTRKDCMFIADGPRPLVLNGQQKIIRATKPGNTIDENILPYVQNITGVNTNYGAGYMDWFLVADEFSGEQFWCPPSIKAMGVYINTDLKYNYWDAPAGLNRGIIQALDCAFSPSIKQAGIIY